MVRKWIQKYEKSKDFKVINQYDIDHVNPFEQGRTSTRFFEKWMNIIYNKKKKVKRKITVFLLVVSDLWTFAFWWNTENTCK